MDFFDNSEENLYKTNLKYQGLYPVNNYGLWHSGIHINPKKQIIKLPYSAEYVESNLYEDDVKSNFIILQSTKNISSNGKNSLKFFTIFKGFSIKEFQNNNKKSISEWNEDSFIDLRNLPFCFYPELTISSTGKQYYYTNYLKDTNGKYYDLNFNELKDTSNYEFKTITLLKNKYYIKKGSPLYSITGKKMGTLNNNLEYFEIDSNKLEDLLYKNVEIDRDSFQLDNSLKLKGLYKISNKNGIYNSIYKNINMYNVDKNNNNILFYQDLNEYESLNTSGEFFLIKHNSKVHKKLNSITLIKDPIIIEIKKQLNNGKSVIILTTSINYPLLMDVDLEGRKNIYQIIVSKNEKNIPFTRVVQYSDLFFPLLYYFSKITYENIKQVNKKQYDIPAFLNISEGTLTETKTKGSFEQYLRTQEFLVSKEELQDNLCNMYQYIQESKNEIQLKKYECINLFNENGNFFDKFTLIESNNSAELNKQNWYYVETDCFKSEKVRVSFSINDVFSTVRSINKENPKSFLNDYIFNSGEIDSDYGIPKLRGTPLNGTCEYIVTNFKDCLNLYKSNDDENSIIPISVTNKNTKRNGYIFESREQFSSLSLSLEKLTSDELRNYTLVKNSIIGCYSEKEGNPLDFILFMEKDISSMSLPYNYYFLRNSNTKCLIQANYIEKKDENDIQEIIAIPPNTDIRYEDKDNYIIIHSFSNKVFIYGDDVFYDSEKKIDTVTEEKTKSLWFINKTVLHFNKGLYVEKNDSQEEKATSYTANKIFSEIKNKKVEYTGKIIDGEREYKISCTYSLGDIIVKKEDYQNFKSTDNKVSILKVYKYDDDINTPGFKEIIFPLSNELKINENIDNKQMFVEINKIQYRKYISDGKMYFIKEVDIKKEVKDLIPEITKNFLFLNYSKNAISDKKTFPIDEIYLRNDDNYDSVKNILRKIAGKEFEKYIGANDSREIYTTNEEISNYHNFFCSKMKYLTCQHPLEFQETLIDNANTNGKLPSSIKYSEKEDCVYEKIKSANCLSNSNNSFFFFCPPLFLEVLNNYNQSEINPYYIKEKKENHKCKPRVAGGEKDQEYEFKINIGFATAVPTEYIENQNEDDNNSNRYKFLKKLTSNINGKNYSFGTLNCPYDRSYAYGNMTDYSKRPHSGIDLPGILDQKNYLAPIFALINGRIWACTTGNGSIAESNPYGSYGRMMIIKGDNDYLYILGHLSSFANHKVGDYVAPGDIVAIAGNTGYSTAAHLHLEMIKCKLGMDLDVDRPRVLNMKFNQLHELDGGQKGSSNAKFMINDSIPSNDKENNEQITGYYINKEYKGGYGSLSDNRVDPLTGGK